MWILGESTDLLSLMSLGSLTSGSCSQRVKYLGYCSIVGMRSGKFIQKRWGSGSLLGRERAVQPTYRSVFSSPVSVTPQPVNSDLVRRGMNGPGRFVRALNSSLQSSAWSSCALSWPTVCSWPLVTHPSGPRMWSKCSFLCSLVWLKDCKVLGVGPLKMM